MTKNPSPQGNVKIKTYHCRNRVAPTFELCNEIVFSTAGNRLYIDGKLVPFEPVRVEWPCKRCGKMIRWYSKNSQVKK